MKLIWKDVTEVPYPDVPRALVEAWELRIDGVVTPITVHRVPSLGEKWFVTYGQTNDFCQIEVTGPNAHTLEGAKECAIDVLARQVSKVLERLLDVKEAIQAARSPKPS